MSALLKARAPACRLQVLEASASQQFLASKRTDQQRALAKLREDPALRCCLLPITQALPVLPGACRMVEHASIDRCNNDAVILPYQAFQRVAGSWKSQKRRWWTWK